jgi:hypothetical protein
MEKQRLSAYHEQRNIEESTKGVTEKTNVDEPAGDEVETGEALHQPRERRAHGRAVGLYEGLNNGWRDASKDSPFEKEFRHFLMECFREDDLVQLQWIMGRHPQGGKHASIDNVIEIVWKWLPIEYWYDDLVTDLSSLVDERRLFDYCSDYGISTRGETEEIIRRVLVTLKISDVQIPISLRDLLADIKNNDLKRILKHMGYNPLLRTRRVGRKDELISLILTGFERWVQRDRLNDFKSLLRSMSKFENLQAICHMANISSEGVKEVLFDIVFDRAVAWVPTLEEGTSTDGESNVPGVQEESHTVLSDSVPCPATQDETQRPMRKRKPRRERTLVFLDQKVPFILAKEIPVIVANALIRTGKLNETEIPVSSGGSSYLVNQVPKHRDGRDFRVPVQLENGWYVEACAGESRQLELVRRLLLYCGEKNATVQIESPLSKETQTSDD